MSQSNSPARSRGASNLISAIGTPLTESEGLHETGLVAQLEDQWVCGIDGVLVAGTMGLLQLVRDETYVALARRSVELSAGRGEVLVGAGDCSYARTRQRIEFLNGLAIDGVVVLTPYFLRFSQVELIDVVLLDVLLRAGFPEHLDGLFAIAPQWAAPIAQCARRGDWDVAAALQRRLIELRRVLVRFGAFQTMTAVLNARKFPGNFAPRPLKPLGEAERHALLAEASVRELVNEEVLVT